MYYLSYNYHKRKGKKKFYIIKIIKHINRRQKLLICFNYVNNCTYYTYYTYYVYIN